MSSEAQRRPTLEEITAFLDQHGLPDTLRGPLEAFVVDYAERGVTMMRPALTSLPTMFADPSTLNETIPPEDAAEKAASVHRAAPAAGHAIDGGSTLVRRGLLGSGGMGNVYRAWEPSLNRVLAMKVLHERFLRNGRVRAQFLVEASITAQLTHPGIPPVHALGEHQQRPCFTMKEVHGQTLASLIHEVHSAETRSWPEARMIGVFNKVCEAVAYAHSRGVVHCDLKPANIMVGAFGEVLVMDWGVARLVEPAGGDNSSSPVAVEGVPPMEGTIAGTPAYMPPEQAAGEHDLMGPTADVFALGVILYELLTGELPFEGNTTLMRIHQVMEGNIRPLTLPHDSIVDDTLESILRKALACEPDARYPHAAALASDIQRWREGAQRRERALVEVREAREALPRIEQLRAQAADLRDRADDVPEDTERVWALEDEATRLEQEAALVLVEVTQKLHAALAHAPELTEAHDLLAQVHRAEHEAAERARDWGEAARQAILLRAHDVGTHAAYIAGTAPLTLRSEPPARVSLYRYVERERRLVPEPVGTLGQTPLVEHELGAGSYLVELRATGRPPVRLPIQVPRSGVAVPLPPEGASGIVHIPAAGEIADHEVYVPPGWFSMGGDPLAPGSGPRRDVWVEGFVIQRLAVCWLELTVFLASEHGREARSSLVRGGASTLFRPDWPAVGLTFDTARAYAAWRSEIDGVPWSLPTEAQWEKAARGVDGRWYPWGDVIHASFAHVRTGTAAPTLPRRCEHPIDVSPYGVVGLAGNTRDWCLDRFDDERGKHLRTVRGGSFLTQDASSRVSSRVGLDPALGHPDVGIRLVRPFPS